MTRTYPTDSGNLVVDNLTIGADLEVGGDLDVAGDTTVVDTTTSGTVIIDVDDAEALLVRKDGDAGDIFTVDTITPQLFVGANFRIQDNVNLAFGSSFDASWDWSTAQASANTLMCGVGGTSNSVIFTSQPNVNQDHDHAAASDPTLFIHSATDPDVDNTQWGSLTHTTTALEIDSGKNRIDLKGTNVFNYGNFTQIGSGFNFDSQGVNASLFSFSTSFDQFAFLAGTDLGRQFIIGDASALSQDFDHATPTNPTLFIHSATEPDSDNTEWGSLDFDGVRFNLQTGSGIISSKSFHEFQGGVGVNTSNTTALRWAVGTDDGVRMSILGSNGVDNNNLIFTKISNKDADHDHDTLSPDPTLFIHSATDPDADNTQWLSLTHDQTDGVIAAGSGNVKIDNDLDVTGNVLGRLVTEFVPIEWAQDGATPPAVTTTLSSGNGSVQIRDFDDATSEDVLIPWQVPANIDATAGIKFTVQLAVSNATGPTAEGVSFKMSGYSVGSGDSINGTFGTEVASDATGLTEVQYDLITTTQSTTVTVTSLAAGEMAMLKLYRDHDAAADDYGQDIGVIGVIIEYTQDL
jgi:hypothetical protein